MRSDSRMGMNWTLLSLLRTTGFQPIRQPRWLGTMAKKFGRMSNTINMLAPILTISRSQVSMGFDQAVNEAMLMLAADNRTLFVGQSVVYDGATMYHSINGVPADKRLEMPVIEDFQLGFCLGLSLRGRIPICIYPRFDFLLLAMNQLVLHLDRFCEMGDFQPKVIVRTRVGPTKPLNAGPQHCNDYTNAFALMLRNVSVVKLVRAEEVMPAYERALSAPESSLIIEANGATS